jgi:hypothetical protein
VRINFYRRLTCARGSQAHDPNAVQLPDGGWGTLVQRQDGSKMILPVKEQPGMQTDDEFERAVNYPPL